MSFYVTLPSHGADVLSEYGKANNKQNDFTINLKDSINLPFEKYEVALVEMSFKNFWKVNLGRFLITSIDNTDTLFDEDIFIYDGMPLEEVCNFLNNKFADLKSELDPDLTMKEYFEKMQKDNQEVKRLYTNYDFRKINFIFLKPNTISLFVPEGLGLKISGLFARLIYKRNDDMGEFLGNKYVGVDWKKFSNFQLNNPSNVEFKRSIARFSGMRQEEPDAVNFYGDDWKTSRLFFNFDKLKCIQELFVYTDIIKESHVGQTMSRLLRVVKVDSDFDNINLKTYDVGHYIDLDYDKFSQIRMIVTDSLGNGIEFLDEFSAVTYKLHFRPKQYYK